VFVGVGLCVVGVCVLLGVGLYGRLLVCVGMCCCKLVYVGVLLKAKKYYKMKRAENML